MGGQVRDLAHLGHGLSHLGIAIECLPTPRRSKIAPFLELERGVSESCDGSVRIVRIRRPCRWQTTQGTAHTFWRALQTILEPLAECAIEESSGLQLRQHIEARIHSSLDGAFAKQIGAESVDGRDVRFLEVLECIVKERPTGGASLLELFADPEFELTSGLFRERDGDHFVDTGLARPDEPYDPPHQLGRLPCSGRGFDDERVVQRIADQIAGCLVGERRCAHGRPRSAIRSARAPAFFLPARRSSDGPHTGR